MEQFYTEDQIDSIAQVILAQLPVSNERATVLALQGDLGAGKTTLTQAIAKALGITETVVSPTFVIAKFYEPLRDAQGLRPFDRLMHIDAYRIEDETELVPLGWSAALQQPRTLIIVEWPERIANSLPQHAHRFSIQHDGDQRNIKKI